MRIRVAAVASAVLACFAVMASGIAAAAPRHNHGLTINVTPRVILANEGVLIYGQLNGSGNAGQTIVLYHHLDGSGTGYSLVSRTKTNSLGFYAFNRAEGVVTTNRRWFVREEGAPGVHSRTVRVRVEPLVSLSASAAQATTRQWIAFTGQVTPNDAGDRIYLQQQVNGGDDWHTLKIGRIGVGSFFDIAYRWRVPGLHNVRVLVRRDVRNIAGASDSLTVAIEQAQHVGFTINTSKPIIKYGLESATISGVLDQAGKTTPDAGVVVTLFAHTPGHPGYSPIGDTTTGTHGSYSFTIMPQNNTDYVVKTTLAPHRSTAVLFEGVSDSVTLSAGSLSSKVNDTVTFSGTVTPHKPGDVVYLQRQGKDGDWHTVDIALIGPSSTFAFAYTFGNPGPHTFRARVPGDPANVGGASAPVTVEVAIPPLV